MKQSIILFDSKINKLFSELKAETVQAAAFGEQKIKVPHGLNKTNTLATHWKEQEYIQLHQNMDGEEPRVAFDDDM